MGDNSEPQGAAIDIGDAPIESVANGGNGVDHRPARKKVVVVGLGMVGISFM